MQSLESLLATLAVERCVGSSQNDQLLSFCETYATTLGYEVQQQSIHTHSWHRSLSSVFLCEESCTVLPSPFSSSCTVHAPLMFASDRADLAAVDASSSILVLHGELARQPLDDAPTMELLQQTHAKALLCLTASHAATGLAPFPLIRSAAFALPSCYAPASLLESLLQAKEDHLKVRLQLFSEKQVCASRQLLICRPQTKPSILVTSALDTPLGSPGALFHASSIAALLGLMEREPSLGVAYLIANGQAYGQQCGKEAFLAENVLPFEEVVSLSALGCRRSQLAYQDWGSRRAETQQVQGLDVSRVSSLRFDCGLPELVLTSSDEGMLAPLRDTQLDTLSFIDRSLLWNQIQAVGDILAL